MTAEVVFIGTGTETFTPTQSGALATVMHELGSCAVADGLNPLIVARRSASASPFDDVPSVLFEYPDVPHRGIPLAARRVERRLRGWTRLCQGKWMASIAELLSARRLVRCPWIVMNEPELAVYLRRQFPDAFIAMWFHNQLPCKPAAREEVARACNVVLTVSEFTSAWVRRYYDLPESKVHTIYNGVDIDNFTPSDAMPAGHPIIQFVGRTGLEKAPDLLLEACLRLAVDTTAFQLRLVGSNHWDRFTLDDYQRRLQSLTRQLESRGVVVEQTGHVGRLALPALMRTAHIHVTPSRWDEPFGLTTLEGMASGLAAIASNTGGSPEVIGDAGLLFERDDPADLAEKLKELVLDKDHRCAIGKRCRARAEQFTWRRTWSGLQTALDSGGAEGFAFENRCDGSPAAVRSSRLSAVGELLS